MRPLAFVDLETTGATAAIDRITEIGIVEVDADGSVREWQQLVNPGVPIPAFIQQLTGISNAMVAAAPSFSAIAGDVLARLQGRLFIAHNARFDYGFLKQELARAGLSFRATTLCTVKLSRDLYPDYRRHSLDALIERHQLRADARHRALADAQLVHQFWQKIHLERSQDAIAEALDLQHANPRLPPEIAPDILEQLPEAPGIYLLYGEHQGEHGRALYVGRARDLRARILSHFPARPSPRPDRKAKLSAAVRHIAWEEIADSELAQRRESALIRELLPPYNRKPKAR